MAKILDDDETQVIDHSGTSRITVPGRWAGMLNLEPGDDCTIAIVNGKHGLFFAVWSENQPNLDEITDDL